jgi:DtxR family Mn-dependent transcriptional regulator
LRRISVADRYPTPTIEDYLGAIYTMERDGETVIGARLAEWMEVSPPTVTATVKRMIRDGWVVMEPSKEIHLTPAGFDAARSVLRRHMLAELLLARVLDVPWSQVHQEADALEHALSPETVERLAAKLHHPETCPHGNPLPGYESGLTGLLPLAEASPGEQVVVRRVHESAEQQPDLMAYLERAGIQPESEVTVVEVMPFNETLTVECPGGRIVLGLVPAASIFVERAT